MTIDTNELLNSILQNLSEVDYIKSVDIPNIDLYMDQVTSFMEKQLKSTKRNEEDKVLTKTKINNYAKNDLLPAQVKKKYSKEQLLLLTFIYYFKNVLTMKDIELLLKPLTEKYFHSENNITIARIYDEVCAFEKERTKLMQKDLEEMYQQSMETFTDVEEEDRQSLQFFSFMSSLILDIYVKKLLLEKLVDKVYTPQEPKQEKDKEKKKK